jgi:phenylalanyl-tRNA synthetase beta chain
VLRVAAERPPSWFRPLPRFPAVRRDLSFVVPTRHPAVAATRVAQAHGGALLESARLFDCYEDPSLGDARGLSVHLVFRAEDRTLQDADVDVALAEIIKGFEAKLGARLRQ